jgi:hypothetical protein
MEPMNTNLDKIEAHLRSLFEEKLFKIFNTEEHPRSLIDDLILVMKQNIITGKDGKHFAPDRFILSVPSREMIKWQVHKDILDEMAAVIHRTGQEEGLIFHHAPIIQCQPNHELQSISIAARLSPENSLLSDTDAMTQSELKEVKNSLPDDAFLIVGGTSNYPLVEPVINIGRHSDNDLVLSDPHVSRYHVQLRAINKRFVIFDLGSIGGTLINGNRITQATLFNGDVIRLGMTNLIFVQTNSSTIQTTTISTDDDSACSEGLSQ